MDGRPPRAEDAPRKEAKAVWVAPRLTYLGNIREIVHGFGKTGANVDSDPQFTAKSGTG